MKRISAVFILLVNCFLLMLTVLPHHHHHEAICFNMSHCHYDNTCGCHDDDIDDANPDARHNHSHDDKCNFSHWLFERTEDVKNHAVVASYETDDCKYAFFPDFLFNIPETRMLEQKFIFLQRRTPSYTQDYVPTIVCPVLGLRAPPHC